MIRLLSLLVLLTAASVARGAELSGGAILKVMPLFLDAKGRSSLSPSLFERDAYQESLRKNPSQRSTLSFDVQWRAATANPVTIRLELRSSRNDFDRPVLLEAQGKPSRWFSTWTQFRIPEADFKKLGEVTAWRATLWSGDLQLGELHSFLW